MRLKVSAILLALALLVSVSANAEVINKEFFHQLKVGEPARSWEHKIDLPDSASFKGEVFVARNLDLRMGKLVIEREELTPTYYYVKVRLPKHPQIPMAGKIIIELKTGKKPSFNQPEAATELKLSKVGASLKPIFTWKTEQRYAAITLYDLTTNKTVWERVSTTTGYKGYDEGYLKEHKYMWAVKVSGENGKYSKEAVAKFRIEKVDGVVVAVPE